MAINFDKLKQQYLNMLQPVKQGLSTVAKSLPPVQAYNAIKQIQTPQFKQQIQSVAPRVEKVGQRILDATTPNYTKPSLSNVVKAPFQNVGQFVGGTIKDVGYTAKNLADPNFKNIPAFNLKSFIDDAAPSKASVGLTALSLLPFAGSAKAAAADAKALKPLLPAIRNARKLLGNLGDIPNLSMPQVRALEDTIAKIQGPNAVKKLNQLNTNAKDYYDSMRVLFDAVEDQILNPGQQVGFSTKSIRGDAQQPLSGVTKAGQTMQSVEPLLEQGIRPGGLESASLAQSTPPRLSQTTQTSSKVTGQIGQTSDDIIANAKKEIGTAPKEKLESLRQSVDRFYTQWVDRFSPVIKAADYAESKIKGSIRPENNPKYLVRRLTGATGIAETRVRRELDPIIQEAENLKIDKGDLDVYLKARRDAGFGEVGRDITGSDPVIAGERMAALEAKYGDSIKQVSDKLYEYQNKGFQEMIDAGFISPEVGATIRSQNPDYVPFQRVMEEVDTYLGLPTKKLMQGTQPIKKIEGSERQIYSPIQSIMENTFKQRAAIEKNAVAKSIVGLSEIAPELGFQKVGQSGSDTITVWNNGQKEFWQVGEDIAETAKGLNEESMNTLLKLFTGPANLLRQGATGRNPEFMLPNIIRDQIDAGISSKYGYIPFIDYLSGLKSILADDDIYKRWELSGAKIDLGSAMGQKTVDEATQRKSLFTGVGRLLDWLGKYSEQPTRVGLFKRAYKATGNDLLSAMESRDATVDFSRMGSKMKVANSIIPFINVGVQGFDKLIRSVRDNPMKVALNGTIYGVLPTTVTTLYNLKEYPEEYAEIPQFERDSNFIIVRGRNSDGTVDYVTFPKGNILPVVANPVQSFIEYSHKQSQQTFEEFAIQFLSSTLPVVGDGQSLQEVGIKTIGSNLPQLIKPAAENLLNKSFYKYDPKKEQTKDIVPSYLQSKPDYQQTFKFTPELYKKIGQVVDASPLKVQNLLEGYLAGYVKIPANIVDVVKSMADGGTAEKNKIPLLRRFIKTTYPVSTTTKKEPEEKKSTIMERVSGEADAAEFTPDKEEEKEIRRQVRESGKPGETTDKYFYKKGDEVQSVPKTYTVPAKPELTGSSELDKKLVAKYKGQITTEGNNIVERYEHGLIDKDTAEKQLAELKKASTVFNKGRKPKKIKFTKISIPKIKVKKLSIKPIKTRIKRRRPKRIKIKVPKIKI